MRSGMKLPVSLLRDFVTTSLTAEQIGDLLTMAGFELEGLDEVGGESVLDIKVMANRGDGLSALGLAREILAKDEASRPTELYTSITAGLAAPDDNTPVAGIQVRIETDACSLYAARVYEDVAQGDSPAWLRDRMEQAGLRSLGIVVDLTNYVMLELGQPLHAFDLDTLKDSTIVVREARAGEVLTTLNGDEHKLEPFHMVICDAEKPVAVAGVMGGLATEMTSNTKRMLLESAHFNNRSVRKTRKSLNLSTEASYRFERSVDPAGVVRALNRFNALYTEITGKGSLPGVTTAGAAPQPESTVSVRAERASLLLGMEVSTQQAAGYLSRLGMDVTVEGDKITAKTPSWRTDLVREDDLVEEIGRVHGYDRIPETPLRGTTKRGGVFGLPALMDTARQAMLRCGFTQILSHSLRAEHPLDFTKDWRVGPRNPHSPEMALLRDSLLPCLADAAQRNGARDLHLFEIGRVFVRGEFQIDESPELAIWSCGSLDAPYWGSTSNPQADFFSLKGVVQELAADLGDHITFDYPRDPDRRFHPTRQSGVLLDNNRLWAGTIGQIHPDLAEELKVPEETFLAELDLLVFLIHDNAEPALKPLSRNPALRRDIAFTIAKATPYSAIEAAIADACGADLEKQWLFDVYEGKGIAENEHSLAISMILRRMGENLTDEAGNEIRDRAIRSIEALGGKLR